MNKLNIRKATINDLEELQNLRNKHFEYEIQELDNYIIDKEWPLSESSKKDFEYFINEQIIFIAEIASEKVGYICGEILPKDDWNLVQIASLTNLFIKKEYRNNGIGTKLIENFKSECRNRRIRNIKVTTLANNAEAIKFYQKNGFAVFDVQMLTTI